MNKLDELTKEQIAAAWIICILGGFACLITAASLLVQFFQTLD